MRIESKKIIKISFAIFMASRYAHSGDSLIDNLISYLAIMVLMGAYVFQLVSEKRIKLNVMFPVIWYAVFVVYVLISGIWALDVTDAYNKPYLFSFILILVAYVIIGQNIENVADIYDFFKAIICANIYMLGVLILKTPLSAWGSDRVGEAVGLNVNSFGLINSYSTLFAMMFWNQTKSRKWLCLILIFAMAALVSGSRKVVLILAVGFSVFLVFNGKGLTVIRNMVLVALLFLVGYYIVMRVSFFYNILGHRIQNALDFLNGGRGDYSSRERNFFFQYGIKMFLERPILGWGSNGFVTQMRLMNYSLIAYSHNNYIELLATEGIVGAILYYGMDISLFVLSMKKSITEKGKIDLFVLAFVCAKLVSDFFVVSFWTIDIQIIMMLLYFLLWSGKEHNRKFNEKGVI